MSANDHLKRLMIETIADNINEMVIGFDSTPATSSDGAAGRPAVTITPTVRIMDIRVVQRDPQGSVRAIQLKHRLHANLKTRIQTHKEDKHK